MRSESIPPRPGAASPAPCADRAARSAETSFRDRLAEAGADKKGAEALARRAARALGGALAWERARNGAPAGERDDGERGHAGERRGRRAPGSSDEARDALGAFLAPPAVLSPPPASAVPSVGTPGASAAELAALLERYVTSLRGGRGADGAPMQRRRGGAAGGAELAVEQRRTDAGVVALGGDPAGDRPRAEAGAARIDAALRARGLDVGGVEVR